MASWANKLKTLKYLRDAGSSVYMAFEPSSISDAGEPVNIKVDDFILGIFTAVAAIFIIWIMNALVKYLLRMGAIKLIAMGFVGSFLFYASISVLTVIQTVDDISSKTLGDVFRLIAYQFNESINPR